MSTDSLIDFKIKFTTGIVNDYVTTRVDNYHNKLEKTLKLTTSKSLTNMWLFDNNQQLKKYDTVYDIINSYIPVRIDIYKLRIKYLLDKLEKEIKLLSNKARFIQEQCDETLDLRRKKKVEVINLLKEGNYDVINEDEEYKYLRTMRIEQVEEENIEKLMNEKNQREKEHKILLKTTPEKMWNSELDILEKEYLKYQNFRKLRNGESIKKKFKKKKKN
tara:strand:+ start:24 stop:677 length:654 start_codon:yes stop_codon:yes gene_type:complete